VRAKTAAWKEELSKIPELENPGKSGRDFAEAFAVVKKRRRRLTDDTSLQCAIHRWLGHGHFDVPICSGKLFCRGGLAEMAGEGKTLVATLRSI